MEIVFTKKYLEDIYQGKTRKYKAYKSNPKLVQQFVKTVNKLKAITKVEQLYQIKSLHYEKKQGDLKGVSAVWVNQQYRILFNEVCTEEGKLEINLFEIEDLSKHYQ